jgi:hypothetical protein
VNDSGRSHQLLHAPCTLREERPKDSACEVRFQSLDLEENRPLHAKCLWLENRNWSVYLMGSSNFTSAGLGIGIAPNLEANLAYVVHQGRNPKDRRELGNSWLDSTAVRRGFRLEEDPPPEEGQDSATKDAILLPKQFGNATFGVDSKQKYFLELSIHGRPPADWVVLHENKENEKICNEREWLHSGGKPLVRIPWNDARPPSALKVRWRKSSGCAWWPVNVIDSKVLPPPEVLRQLSLDELVAILTSASPLHQAMGRILLKKGSQNGSYKDVSDPHRRVALASASRLCS